MTNTNAKSTTKQMSRAPASRRQQVFTGVAAVLILALAFWLLLGRSPKSSSERVQVSLGTAVPTDVGKVTVTSLDPVASSTNGVPAPLPGHEVRAIRFRSCRTTPEGQLVDLSLFSVRFADGTTTPAAGSNMTEAGADCVTGLAYVQVPASSAPSEVDYGADPVAVWVVPGAGSS